MSANYEQLQEDVASKLLSEELLALVNVQTLRRMQAQSEVNAELIWSTPRGTGTKAGVGILVGMPTFTYPAPNVSGPERTLMIPVSVFEHPIINQHPDNGTRLSAETITDYVDAILARFNFTGIKASVFTKSSKPNTDIAGLIRYDSILECTLPRTALVQCVAPRIDDVSTAAAVTITNNEVGSSIYYTTDGTFPGSGNPTAVLYSGAFAVASGTYVRCASYLTGKIGSDEEAGTIT